MRSETGFGADSCCLVTPAESRDELSEILVVPDPTEGLWQYCDSGRAGEIVPELPALLLEQDPIHRHKDVLAHTIAVTAKTPPVLKLRLAALFHDVGKPATRSFDTGAVTFRHHEAVGAKMARKRLRQMQYEPAMIKDVTELVRLSGRFKGYGDGWSDSAVRRYAREAGPLLGDLNQLIRCDCTTRNRSKEARLHRLIDELEERVVQLAKDEAEAAKRPQMDGQAVMERFGVSGGPTIGKALKFLMALRNEEGDLAPQELEQRLDAWWAENGPEQA